MELSETIFCVVRERATWCYPVFHIFDSLGSAVLKVKGPMFHFGLCGASVPFEVTSVEKGSQVEGLCA